MRALPLLLTVLASVLPCGCGRAGASPLEAEVARLTAENEALRSPRDPLPASLDALYPPRSPRPTFLLGMVELGTALDAVAADALEGDPAGARVVYERFARAWHASAQMVPEWRGAFPDAPVTALEVAVREGDPARVMQAVANLGEACNQCHAGNMVATQLRHRWGDFAAIEVGDPGVGQEESFTRLMHTLAVHLAGIGADAEEGQIEAARQHLEGLRGAYERLEGACSECHASPRTYYVGEAIGSYLEGLDRALSGSTPDSSLLKQNLANLGEASCLRCHLVHVPAALAAAERH